MSARPDTVVPCNAEVLPEISLRSLERAVGTAAVARGLSYARERAVRDMHWDPAEGVLHGRVRGQGTNVYATTAHLSAEARPEFEWGDCSCPVAFNCKHVAALILTTLFTQPDPAGAAGAAGVLGAITPGAAGNPVRRRPGPLRRDIAGHGAIADRGRAPGGQIRPDDRRLPAEADRPAGAAGQERGLGGRQPQLEQAQLARVRRQFPAGAGTAAAGDLRAVPVGGRPGGLLRLLPLRRRQDHRSVGVRLTPALATAGAKPRRPACGWCTTAGTAWWTGAIPRSSASTSRARRNPAR